MDNRWHRMRAAAGFVTTIVFLSLLPHPASGQGFLRGYFPACCCQSACSCGNGSSGEAGSAYAGSPTGDQYADSQFNLGEAGPATPIPNTGDDVRWVANGKHYAGRVKSRLISYSGPKMSVGRTDDFDITAVLVVELGGS